MLKIRNPNEAQMPTADKQQTDRNALNEMLCILITSLSVSTGGFPPGVKQRLHQFLRVAIKSI